MGKGKCSEKQLERESHTQILTWEEVGCHRGRESQWIVIDDNVYDITRWQKKHPGGARIISHYAGQDATEVWNAMHNNKEFVSKFMKPLYVGKVRPSQQNPKQNDLTQDFRELRQTVTKLGLFHVDPVFFIGHLFHILVLEVLAYSTFCYFGVGWIPYLIVTILLTTSQAQAGWTQHDYGHLSVFNSSKLNHLMHYFVIGHLKAASSHWWTFRHHQHHAKPNALGKDPDVNTAYLFMLGEKIPKKWGDQKRGILPYQWQHRYFWILGPPTLLPIYFHLENIYFVFKRHDWIDMVWMLSFFARYFYMYGPLLGGWGAFGLYMLVRFLESHWFTFVTQMNHIAMEIDKDQEADWVTAQLQATCNVHQSWFNDWFSGHLNFQIEHHLFPTMPRHNYVRAMPLVKSLCEKHNLKYISKPLGTAFADILRSLRKSGELWYNAYYHV